MKKKSSLRNSTPIKPNEEPQMTEENMEHLILLSCTEMQKITTKVHKANLLKTKENKIKDNEIDELNEKIDSIMLTNLDLQEALQKELENRHFYEREQKKIADYCNELNYKFHHMEKTISDYENTVKNITKENQDLVTMYDKKIEEIDLENKKIQKRIDDRIELFEHQKNEIFDKTAKINFLKVEIQRAKDDFNQRTIFNRKRIEELQKEYKDLQKNVYDLQIGCNVKKCEGAGKVGSVISPEEKKKMELKEIEKKIENCEQGNNELIEEFNELRKQYKEMKINTERDVKVSLKGGDGITSGIKTNRSSFVGGGNLFNFKKDKK